MKLSCGQIVFLVLGESMNENCQSILLITNNGASDAAFSLPLKTDSFLEEMAAKIGFKDALLNL